MMAATHRITRVSLTLGAVLGIVLSGGALLGQSSADIPPDPRKLVYPPLDYSPPDRAAHRHQLSPGVVAYLVEDHSLPLVNVQLVMRIGRYLDSPQQVGLAAAVGSLLRSGGTSRWPAEKFDEEADFLAANISSRVGQTSASARVNALSKDLDQALDLFFEMLRNPAFEQQRVDLYKSQLLQRLERRNDRTGSIERREWNRLLRGDEHFSNRFTTNSSAEAFTPENLRAFHQKHYVPANFILAVSGSFDTAEMKAKLAEHLAKWEQAGERSQAVPRPDHQPQPGLYLVHKEDVNQGRVSIGHLGIERKNPDRFAVSLMNQVLGGSGFTSRITNRVRSDEGLAYSAGSSFSAGDYYPGAFRAFFSPRAPPAPRQPKSFWMRSSRSAKRASAKMNSTRSRPSRSRSFPGFLPLPARWPPLSPTTNCWDERWTTGRATGISCGPLPWPTSSASPGSTSSPAGSSSWQWATPRTCSRAIPTSLNMRLRPSRETARWFESRCRTR